MSDMPSVTPQTALSPVRLDAYPEAPAAHLARCLEQHVKNERRVRGQQGHILLA